MRRIGVIILCRFNSSRLPGKILLKINGIPILKYIVDRLRLVVPIENIVVATSDEKSDDAIEQFCIENNTRYYRGNLHNVASRFLNCAIENQFDFAIRINGDNIFIDIDLLREVIERAESESFSFISNVQNRTFPKGMSIEGISVDLYKSKISDFTEHDNEHVMTYFYRNADSIEHLFIYNQKYPELAGVQLAIDTKEDFEKAKHIIDQLNIPQNNFNLKEIAGTLKITFKK